MKTNCKNISTLGHKEVLVVLVMLIAGCGVTNTEQTNKPTSEQKNSDKAMTICQEPRPEICIQIYKPVCAKLQDGSFKTYASDCTACSDPKVIGYRDRSCE